MNSLTLKSHAKINIGLNVISKREDGFHNLETIFYPINLFDEITFTKSDVFNFNSDNKILNDEKNNLIVKSIYELEKFFNTKFFVETSLIKNIPIGAGLGGGSSNAATTLLGLLKLFELNIPQNDLLQIALQLGSDVPFFLNPIPSFAESRGEILTPINIKINKYILIVNPGIHIATKWAFELVKPELPVNSLKNLLSKSEIKLEDLHKSVSNDFENIVFKQYPEIKEIKNKMLEFGAELALMTGTGSTVWGIFDEEEPAYQTELYFKCRNFFTYIESPI